MWRFIYNLFLPVGFIFFLPGVIYKYRNRGGWKDTFAERFGIFSADRKEELKAYHGAIWIHSVSVGETVLAVSMIEKYKKLYPGRKFVISTTTTTGQEIARKKTPADTAVIFCPIDFPCMVKRTLNVIQPSMLVIFETELWPNMVAISRKRGIPVALVNGRMSDHSAKGYRRAKCFFAPMLETFNAVLVQSDLDAKRFLDVSPFANVQITGNLKFDQTPPADLQKIDLAGYFGGNYGTVILAASTHPGEEDLITDSFSALKAKYPDLKLVIVPRHAERGSDIGEMIKNKNIACCRRSCMEKSETPVDILVADTTGEMFRFIASCDIVIMGKSLAGQDEGHNLIEPALLSKPIVTGSVLRNFRFILDVLTAADAVKTVKNDTELTGILDSLVADPDLRETLGKRASAALAVHCGASERTIEALEKLLCPCENGDSK